jgi:hypothetical protein
MGTVKERWVWQNSYQQVGVLDENGTPIISNPS